MKIVQTIRVQKKKAGAEMPGRSGHPDKRGGAARPGWTGGIREQKPELQTNVQMIFCHNKWHNYDYL